MEILRIILITLGSIIGFIFLIAALIIFCRIKVELVYGSRKFIRIHFLFFRYTIDFDKINSPKKKEKLEKKEAKEKNKADKKAEIANDKEIIEKEKSNEEKKKWRTAERLNNLSVSDIFSIIDAVIQKFIKKLYFNIIELNISVATPEADKTAILYGQINAGIYPILGFIDSSGRLGKTKINVIPDFTAEKISLTAHVIVSTRVLHMLSCLFYLRKEEII
ncbi:MAG: hypothetical protein DBX47_07305 [Clostridiales bacterium]|nr:MAG: hypothetical protein DBX47_07305 [Clostridiales bacterium]